jgi:RimJ/RimL family protein N-acetyltransferase
MRDEVLIREGRVEDARELIAMMQEMTQERGVGIPLEPGEFQNTVEQEEAWIRARLESDNSLILVAVTKEGGEIVGLLDCTGGERRAMRHQTVLGISVKKEWRGKGVGRKLMERAMEWARENETVKRVQLEVFATNEGAIHLYEKMGFEKEGVRRKAFWREGEWMDSIVMAKLLGF